MITVIVCWLFCAVRTESFHEDFTSTPSHFFVLEEDDFRSGYGSPFSRCYMSKEAVRFNNIERFALIIDDINSIDGNSSGTYKEYGCGGIRSIFPVNFGTYEFKLRVNPTHGTVFEFGFNRHPRGSLHIQFSPNNPEEVEISSHIRGIGPNVDDYGWAVDFHDRVKLYSDFTTFEYTSVRFEWGHRCVRLHVESRQVYENCNYNNVEGIRASDLDFHLYLMYGVPHNSHDFGEWPAPEDAILAHVESFSYAELNVEIVAAFVGGALGVFALALFIGGVFIICFLSFVCVRICVYKSLERVKKREKILDMDILKSIDENSSTSAIIQRTMREDYEEKQSNIHKIDEIDHRESVRNIANIKVNEDLFTIDIDELKVLKSIGSGAFCKVYLAIWCDNEVAFKCFDTKYLGSSQDDFNSFEREIALVSSLSHVNIPRFFGGMLKPPRVGIVMEYCPGGDIKNWVLSENPGIKERIRMLRELSNGMRYLHSKNVIHRDLKPDNALLDKNKVTKIIDFGLSRALESRNSEKTKRIGTSVYMAPEVYLGGNYTNACDVFSYAIMCFCVLSANFHPYGSKNSFQIEARVANDASYRPPISELTSKNIQDIAFFVEIMQRCWRAKFEERPSFAEIYEFVKEGEKGL